jgi:hypothetical protein
MKQNLFDVSCLISVCCFLALLFFGIALLVVESIKSMGESAAVKIYSQWHPELNCVVLLFFICVFLLWIRGWKFLLKGWPKRATELNLVFLILHILTPVISAYLFHFLSKRKP